MATLLYSKGKENGRKISNSFSSGEFDCPCNECTHTIVNLDFIKVLEVYRTIRNRPVTINHGGGYRCASYQQQLRLRGFETSQGKSQHELGNAADVSDGITPGYELADDALKAGFTSIGTGKLFIHVDGRPGIHRWTYKT